MEILVTGGAGFIGSFLTERLLAEGHSVTVLDNLSTGSRNNLSSVLGHERLRFIEGSILDEATVDGAVEGTDCVFHLAAAVGVRLIMEKPSESLLLNILGTERVLAACLKENTRVFIASTSEVYGKSRSFPQKESDDLILGATENLRWSYACAKMCDEVLALSYYRERQLPATVLRFFNTTGPRQSADFGMVLPNFVGGALAGRPLIVHGEGQQTRCFCHVEDVIEALIRLLDRPETVGKAYNIGTDEEVTIAELAKKVVEITGSKSEIQFIPYKQAYGTGFEDMQRRRPDLTQIENATGFRPRITLDRIIGDVIKEIQATAA